MNFRKHHEEEPEINLIPFIDVLLVISDAELRFYESRAAPGPDAQADDNSVSGTFAFTGEDADIRLDGEHPEFADWRWLDAERLPDLAVSFKRAIYLSVVDEFRPLWA